MATVSLPNDWNIDKLTPAQFAQRMAQRQLQRDRTSTQTAIDQGLRRWNASTGQAEETQEGRNLRESSDSVTRSLADQRRQIEAQGVGGGAGGGGGFNLQSGFGDLTRQAKDLAEFNLGLNQRQGNFDFDLRNREFDNNTGRQQRINEQQNKWQSDLNRDTQEAQTRRLGLQIEGQDRQQRTGIDQENFSTNRAVRLASRRLGRR